MSVFNLALAANRLNPLPQEGQESMLFTACLLGAILLALMIMLTAAIRVVPENSRLVIFRLGRLVGAVGPGIVFLLPVVDRGIPVSLSEQSGGRTDEPATTRDGARLLVDWTCRYKIIDPTASLTAVAKLEQAMRDAGGSRLRARISEMDYADIFHEQEAMRSQVEVQLAETAHPWGVEVTGLDLRDLRKTG